MAFPTAGDDPSATGPKATGDKPSITSPKSYVKNLVDTAPSTKTGLKRGFATPSFSQVSIRKTARRKGVHQKLNISK